MTALTSEESTWDFNRSYHAALDEIRKRLIIAGELEPITENERKLKEAKS